MGEETGAGATIDTSRPVTRELILRIRANLEVELRDLGSNSSEYRGESISRSRYAILDYLDHIIENKWNDTDDEHHRFIPESGKSAPKTLDAITSCVRKALRLSCRKLFPNSPAYVGVVQNKSDGYHTLIWDSKKKGVRDVHERPASVERFEEVVVLGKLLRTDFAVDFMRGAHAMAHELGIGLSDRRGMKRTYEDLESAMAVVTTLDPARHSIFLFFEAPTSTDGFARSLSRQGFTVVETGFNDERTIGVDNKALASSLMGCLTEDAAGRSGIVLDLAFDGISSGSHGVVARSEVYKSALLSSRTLAYEQVPVRGYVYDDDIGERIVESLDERLCRPDLDESLSRPGAASVVAITSKTEKSTIATVDFLRGRAESLGHIACYSESLVFGVLNRLYDPRSPLRAVCGLDFFHFGRYATRVCSVPRRWGQSVSKIRPLLITKEEALSWHLFSTDRIPANFKDVDVRLAGPEFA